MIFIVQSQNNLQKIASLNISFSYSISKGCAVKFRPFTSSALNRSIARWSLALPSKNIARPGEGPESRAHYISDQYLPPGNRISRHDFENEPHDLAENLHTDRRANSKNFFLLTFFWENSFSRVFCVFLVFFHLFSSLINQ